MRALTLLLVTGCMGGVPYDPPDSPGSPGDAATPDALAPEGPDEPETAPPVAPPVDAPEPEAPAGDEADEETPQVDLDRPIAPLPEDEPEAEPEATPGDEPGEAAPLTPGVEADGEIVAGGAQFWRVELDGPWRIDVRFRHADGDLDVHVWDVLGGGRKTDRSGRPIGSESDDDDEEFVFRRPAVVRVQGWEAASNRYRILLTAL